MSHISTDDKAIEWFLTHGVERVYPRADLLRDRLRSGEVLTAYYGIDPTGPTLHLGHLVTLKKLAELQALGHKIILLIGDFTAMIGDPTDKLALRKLLTREEVITNCRAYHKQASRVLAFDGSNPAEIRFNSDWLARLTFAELIHLASEFTVQQMLERDMFHKRLKNEQPIHLHEFLYPLMQGYDSVAMNVDIEIGGNDQTFNMLAGRTLMKSLKNKEKFVVTNKLLVDSTGVKMGKTTGNMIALTDTPEDMYGKVMSWPDEMIVPGFEICTNASVLQIKTLGKNIKSGKNPMEYKRELARQIVAWLVGEKEAEKASDHFIQVHQKREMPDEIPVFFVSVKDVLLCDLLVLSTLVSSKSEARRQITQGAIKVGGVVISDVQAVIRVSKKGIVIQKGKRFFAKIQLK